MEVVVVKQRFNKYQKFRMLFIVTDYVLSQYPKQYLSDDEYVNEQEILEQLYAIANKWTK